MRNLIDNPLLLIVLLLIIVLVFGAKRLPDAARSVGRSMKIFKSELKDMRDEDTTAAASSGAPLEGRVVDHRPVVSRVEVRGDELLRAEDANRRR